MLSLLRVLQLDEYANIVAQGLPEWLIQSTSFYLVVSNEHGDFIYANNLYTSTFLEPDIDISKVNFSQKISLQESELLINALQSYSQESQTKPLQIINKHRIKSTENYKSIKWECNRQTSSGEGKAYFLHVGHDVVAMEHVDAHHELTDRSLNQLFDDLQIGVVVQGEDSRNLLSNHKAEELLGLTKDQIYGRTLYDENWKIIKTDQTPFPAEELPTTQAISTKKHIQDVVMGVFNPRKQSYVWLQVDANPELDEKGHVFRVITTFIDISKRRAMEEKARKQQLQLHTMMDNAPMVIFMKDLDGKYMFFNKMYKDFMGKELRPGLDDYDIFEEDFADWCKAKDQAILDEDQILSFEHNVKGEIFFETKFPIKDSDGNIYAIGGFSQNITKQKEEQELLRLQESVITNTRDSILITEANPADKEGPKIIFANQAFFETTGYTKEEVIGKTPHILQGPNTDKTELDRLRKALENFESCEIEVINYKKNGEEYWVKFNVIPVFDKEGHCTHWISVQQDTTKRKKKDKVLKDALQEKTTLLSEIHHRVKNNLAIVSGLLELQSLEVDSEHKLPLQRSINRIQSIAMVHELMYQTEMLSSVNIKKYLDELIPAIHKTMQPKSNVDIKLDLENYEVNINQAIPLGLLINELITNSFKYAFTDNDSGKIQISMISKGKILEFRFKDNGPGFSAESNFDHSNSLGLNLIHAQLDQLHADYEVETEGHFDLKFKFKISERGPHSNIK